jgi:hypothetical protein
LALNPASAQLISNWGLVEAEAAARAGDQMLGIRATQAAADATSLAPRYWLFWRSLGYRVQSR